MLMRPVLEEAAGRDEVHVRDVVDLMAGRFGLSEAERQTQIPSGRGVTLVQNRTHWAKTYLAKAGLLEGTRRGWFRITSRGRAVLGEKPPPEINSQFLRRFPEFVDLVHAKRSVVRPASDDVVAPDVAAKATGAIASQFADVEAGLRIDLIERVLFEKPAFFERLLARLALALGYGGGRPDAVRVIGRGGDGGIDVEIDEDALGLDRLLLQAKRYQRGNSVGDAAVRDFAGSLRLRNATKGVIVTTSTFTPASRQSAERLGIILIDGDRLAALMICYDVGVRIEQTFHIKKIDEDFFLEE